jgi:hypothetical protein
LFKYNGELIPYAYLPKQFFNAGLKVSSAKLPDPWDFEKDYVALSYNFGNASRFIKVEEWVKDKYRIVVSP